ncbi:MAG: DUF3667 domain-containing protein [Flavobacteriaceae bacterium]|nr:DUF3667 domain-containing protein [Muriicola sp.]MBT8289235.1 DUF3667 domain-containing protein [Muriicola sp.]NNK34428.1 DUF3667 domain-containing protein [Eudoraea sp.]NNL39047.1 DUF3667 domain-containing protein [Flavobacteriaceae bacterium]
MEFQGNFCPRCGQRSGIHKVTFKETFQDLANNLFSINAPLLITIRDLILRPGVLLRSYLGGKRRTYYRPVSFFILMTVLYIVIRSVIGFDPFRNSMIVVEEGGPDPTLLTEARNYMLMNINNFLFVFVFTLALFLKLFFYKRYSLAEYIAISFYLLGIYTLIVTCNMFVVQAFGDQLQPLGSMIMCLFFLYAMVSFFQRKYFFVIVKSFILYILAFMTYAMSSFAISFLIVYIKQG